MSTPIAALDVVTGFLQALDDRRIDDLDSFLADDVVDHNKVIHGEPDEPGAALEAFRMQLTAFGELDLAAEEYLVDGNRVLARLRVRGRHTGAHPRMPEPTQRTFDVEQMWLFTVRHGRIAEIRAVSDRLGMFIQLGWPWPQAT